MLPSNPCNDAVVLKDEDDPSAQKGVSPAFHRAFIPIMA